MTALKRNAGAFLLAAAMAVLLCLAVTPGSAFGDDAISKTTIGTAAEEYLESMANLLATGTPEQESAAFIRAKKSISDSEMQRELRKEICNWRERLKPDVEYSSASSNLTIEAQRVDEDGRILVDAIEETMLINKHSGVEQRFGGRHVFVFEGQGKDWTLVEDRQIDPTGLLPEGKDLRFVYGGEEEVSPGEEGDAVALSEISGEPVDCLPEVEASTAKPEDLGEDASQIAPQAVAPTGYDAIKAAKYLEKYYLHPNAQYRNFDKRGGDCTNFASQALYAGGWKMKRKGSYEKDYNYWWYAKTTQSKSWVNVVGLGSFARLSHRCSMLNNVWKLRLGDMLQVQPQGSKVKTHTMMVSYVKNGEPYFTYRSKSSYRVSLSTVLKKYPGAKFFAYDIQ